jgi:hypothetical protein
MRPNLGAFFLFFIFIKVKFVASYKVFLFTQTLCLKIKAGTGS